MSTGLPFDRTRYNPVQEITPEEAARNRRAMGKNRAAEEGPNPPGGSTANPDDDKAAD